MNVLGRFALLIVAAAFGVYLSARNDDTDPVVLWWTGAIIAVIILIPFAWYMIWYRGKMIVIETDGVRLANKVLIPWDGLIDADTWTSRGTTLVKVSVTPRFMQEYQSRQSWGSRLLTKTNSTLGGGDAPFFRRSCRPIPTFSLAGIAP